MSREREPLPPAWEVGEDGTRTPMPRMWVKKPGPPVQIPRVARLVHVKDLAGHPLAFLYREGEDNLLWLTGHFVGPSFILLDGFLAVLAKETDPETGAARRKIGRHRSVVALECPTCPTCPREADLTADALTTAMSRKTRRGKVPELVV